ncbi:Rne/Rng family ribonuclease [Pseudoclavibacter chungangensis]|uniref:Ribonuclease E n=1 Tax=Pseudoclavibacter chungangensis TaxID=587635 RepID=A0A7J5BR68_9MICO|nr:Rne/Rng family ribonuclease [Pseudoclavibacter chungangensis]KAB1656791.1 Rne/Rng family ribonuclease [Pseudoclavibacter chungangensis]NYJ67237.1 ribonuclease E [Pseudoclavibacter chungangensis]
MVKTNEAGDEPTLPTTESDAEGVHVGLDAPDAAPGTALVLAPAADESTDDAAQGADEPAAVGADASTEHAAVDVPAASDAEAATPSDDEDDDAPSGGPVPAVITTTTLFFLAPDLPPLAERERQSQRAEPERGSGDRRRSRPEPQEETDEAQDQARSKRRTRKEREPQPKAEVPLITEPQRVKGSTRLEAKRQRRREGREIGRRRPVVTESEFLARREAVDRVMIVRAKDNRVQLGVLEDRVLVEHYVARSSESSLIGNVYLGRVQNVLPSMEAAFVDIGRGRNAVLYSGEVDWAAADLGNGQARRIENALKPGDRVLVQVTKDPVGHKGARLTSQVSLPGRYLVYVPGNQMNGISRKLPDTERARLKRILKEVLPQGVGVIVRTAAEGATREQLERDVERLTRQWNDIQSRSTQGPAPALLHAEPDLLIKIIRDVFNEDFQKLVIQGDAELEVISNYLRQVAPDLLERVERYEGDDVFAEYRATEAIEKALERKVWLPSGGSLVIDRTEAMTVVDVNTGKFVGSGGNLEETVTKNNLEAAEEVVRQLRLRDIGGIIVIDFIDMVLESNRDLVLRRLVECLSRDRTKHQVAEVTSLGLVQMTRKKLGLGLLETFSEPCEICAGRGVVVSNEPVHKHHASNGGDQNGGGRGRRGRGGQQQSNDAAPRQSGGNGSGAHSITDEARGALSKIAASTIAGTPPKDAPVDPIEAAAPTETAEDAAPEREADEPREGRRRSRRGKRRRGDGEGRRSGDESQAPAATGDDASSEGLPVLELPEPKQAFADERTSADPTALAALDSLLDSIGSSADDAAAPAPTPTDDEPVADEPASPDSAAAEPEAAPAEIADDAAARAAQRRSGRRQRGSRRARTAQGAGEHANSDGSGDHVARVEDARGEAEPAPARRSERATTAPSRLGARAAADATPADGTPTEPVAPTAPSEPVASNEPAAPDEPAAATRGRRRGRRVVSANVSTDAPVVPEIVVPAAVVPPVAPQPAVASTGSDTSTDDAPASRPTRTKRRRVTVSTDDA